MSLNGSNGDKQKSESSHIPPGVFGYYADSSVRSKVRPLLKQGGVSSATSCSSKARGVSSRPLLESVSESEDVSDELQTKFHHYSSDMKNVSLKQQQSTTTPTIPPPPPSNQQSARNEKHYFGVKSHLHHFYDSYKGKGQYTDDSEDYTTEQSGDEDSHYLIAPNKRKHKCCVASFSSVCWRTGIWSGLFIFIIGTIFMFVGFVVPRKNVVVKHVPKLEIVDRAAEVYNSNLDLCRYIGLGLFCCGVAIITISLLLPSFIKKFYDADFSKNVYQHQEPFKWKVGILDPPKSPTEKVIPATEEVAGVQPKADSPKSVVLAQTGIRDLR